MPFQILTLKLDGITAGDYLTWCRDPDPPALEFALRSISIDADPLGDTITAILDWNQPPPPAWAAAITAGLPLTTSVQVEQLLTDTPPAKPGRHKRQPTPTRPPAAVIDRASGDAEQRPFAARAEGQLRTAA